MSLAYSLVLILLPCVCMHACTARPFGFENGEDNDKHKLDSVQESVRKIMIGETSGESAMIDGGVKDLHAINQNLSVLFDALLLLIRIEHAGNDSSRFSSIVTSHRTTDVEVSRKRALSRIGSSSHGEKALDSNLQEDGLVVDYEPPRHSPPIHNRRR
ncbi:hypothetical protein K2173_027298 [Erythroxylum novogranatense]|uniref:Uncharacterized protein n=1 Tax=Erythroxylum novogranatense TaxID=1862640 RepID=A0AAV8TYN5_9ROSI|nr:hypothetical protein K2173_027298 [Erythroxylum novogranatense]